MKRAIAHRGLTGRGIPGLCLAAWLFLMCLCLIGTVFCSDPAPEDSYSALLKEISGILKKNRSHAEAAQAAIAEFSVQSSGRIRKLRKALAGLEPVRAMTAYTRLEDEYRRILSYVEQNDALRGSVDIARALGEFMP